MANLKEIQEFLENISKTDLYKIKFKTEDLEMTVQLKEDTKTIQTQQPVSQPIVHHKPQQNPVKEKTENIKKESDIKEKDSNLLSIKSPIVGTFYRKPNPEKPPFVELGQKVKKGDVVCIIEAMKLFNEIESEVSGEIVEILAEDATPVEFDQPLFLVKPV